MNKKLLMTIIVVILILIIGGYIINKQSSYQTQLANIKQAEKKLAKDLGLKEGKPNIPSYPRAKVDEDRCGKDAFYVQEKSADFVKNYCKFLEKNGWKLNHPDYSNCDDIRSTGGGYNYDKGKEKIAVSVIRYGQDGTCYWIFKRSR